MFVVYFHALYFEFHLNVLYNTAWLVLYISASRIFLHIFSCKFSLGYWFKVIRIPRMLWVSSLPGFHMVSWWNLAEVLVWLLFGACKLSSLFYHSLIASHIFLIWTSSCILSLYLDHSFCVCVCVFFAIISSITHKKLN